VSKYIEGSTLAQRLRADRPSVSETGQSFNASTPPQPQRQPTLWAQ
jgi:hypothetical protein